MRQVVGIAGGGSFGRGLAFAARRNGKKVVLWSRSARDLGDEGIRATTDVAQLGGADLVFVCVPSTHVLDVAKKLEPHLDGRHLVVHVSRGLVGDSLETVGEALTRLTAVRRIGALAGPLVASALERGEPGGGIIGSAFPEVAAAVRDAIGGPKLRIYDTRDQVGVELASALCGLLALTTGFAQALGLGPGTLAVLATRGVFEAARIGAIRGAQERTFAGLAGFGDLMAAVAGDGRPEVEFGRVLGKGIDLEAAARAAGANVEGVTIARRVAEYAALHDVDAPLSAITARMLEGEVDARQAVAHLMERPARSE